MPLAHFKPVHGKIRIPWTQVPVPGVHIEYETDWFVDRGVPWKMHFLDNAVLPVTDSVGASCRSVQSDNRENNAKVLP